MGDEVVINYPGFKFSPSDEVLLRCYLLPKLCGKKLPCNMVEEKEIYGSDANPWHLFNASSTSWIDSSKCEKTVYVFTRLTKKAASSCPATDKKTEHYVRKAGCGTWHDETGRKRTQIMVRDGENVFMGNKRLLVYRINDIGGLGEGIINLDEVGYWKMHEYCLDGFEDCVLCAITWDTSKKAKVVSSKKTEVVSLCPKTLSGSRSSTKRNTQSDTHITSNDDCAKVGNVDPRLSSEKNSGVPDLGLVQDNYVVQEGSLNWMNTDCTLPASSTSCPNNVSGDGLFPDLEYFLSDFSHEELADLDLFTDFSVEEFLAAFPSSPPDNNNDEQHPMQNCSSHVLGKRKSTEAETGGKKLCI
ncbi:hypothetical protein POM88_027267 [Heracleum sosnowskyi]|uniref:NAC domain-containing protein n=1 Tax=Heracleum sosnowskyi TaxID=360622 RepID=A0AAD8MQU2_9APIA|nr:hypothetical protein POM88_027267 [Heracleum sosnowskyi]